MTKLVYGMNPLHIAHVEFRPARRLGDHPYKAKLFEKKHPWMAAIVGNPYASRMFDMWWPASVSVIGPCGREIKHIPCSSNREAYDIKEDLEAAINNTLTNLLKGK